MSSDTNPKDLLMLSACAIALSGFGFLLRLHKEHDYTIKKLNIHRLQEKTATELHDIVCNDLTYALYQLNCIRNDLSSSATQRSFDIDQLDGTQSSIEEALHYTRAAIATLSESDAGSRFTQTSISINIAPIIEKQKTKLAKTGFIGTVITSNINELATDNHRKPLIEGFIRETFGNILKHADPTQGYVVTIQGGATSLSISATDIPLARQNAIHSDKSPDHHQGTGLQSYQTRLAALGGKLSISTEDGQWSMEATVPLSDNLSSTRHNTDTGTNPSQKRVL